MKKINNIIIKRLCLIALLVFTSAIASVNLMAQSEQTMYWIGGSGNWNDLSHWSFNSGKLDGTVAGQPSSVPTSNTNVIFDGNSGGIGSTTAYTVTLNVSATVKSLTFAETLTAANSPTISFGSTLSVTEDVTLQRYIAFTSSSDNSSYSLSMQPVIGYTSTLTTNGAQMNTYFSKKGAGDLNIEGEINSNHTLEFNGGTINYSSESLTNAYISVTGSTINFPNLKNFLTSSRAYTTRLWVNSGTINFPILETYDTGGGISTSTSSTSKINFPELTSLSTGALSIGGINTLLDCPKVLSITVSGSCILGSSATLNAPSCRSFTGGSMTHTSSVPLLLPELETFTLAGNMSSSNNYNSVITLGENTKVTVGAWPFLGRVNANRSVFNIINGNFCNYKAGNKIYKVIIKNLSQSAEITNLGIIDELIFEKVGGSFPRNGTVNILQLAPSQAYTITSGSILTITGTIIDNTAACEAYYSISNGTINNNSGETIKLTNAVISNIASKGTNGFEVTGIDGGGNTATTAVADWIFTEPAGKTLYWVGDAGNHEWNDKSNWSDGGGAYCMPTRFDNVIFNESSIVTEMITVTGVAAEFHDITVTDGFTSPPTALFNGAMYCYGSWHMLKPDITMSNQVVFCSVDLNETITTSGAKFSTIEFNGTGGWILQDDFTASSNLTFTAGILNTNSRDVTIKDFKGYLPALSHGNRSLILGSSTLSVSNWYYAGNLNAGTSHIIVSSSTFTDNLANSEYYNVTATYSSIILNVVNGKFNSVTASKANATVNISNSMEVKVLNLPPNCTLIGTNGIDLTITEDIITNTPDCSGLMVMHASILSDNNKFNLKSDKDIHIPNVWMQRVHASKIDGSAGSFTATGIDEGNNSGWTFSSSASKDLYWIGGAGNWDDPLHWTTNSDGNPIEGGCVPTMTDNVYFNRHSSTDGKGFNIIVPSTTYGGRFNNMITENDAPSGITFSSIGILYCYGNIVKLGKAMKFNTIQLIGNVQDGEWINSSSSTTYSGTLTINNANAKWKISNDMIKLNTFNITNAAQVDFEMDKWKGNNISINNTTLNLNLTNLESTRFALVSNVTLNAENVDMKFTGTGMNDGFQSSSSSYGNSVNIKNANITTTIWKYIGSTTNANSNQLQADGSKIMISVMLTGYPDHKYNIVETSTSTNTISGGININDLILNGNSTISNNNKFGKITLIPKGLTLRLAAGSTQTIESELILNGTPCNFNYLRAGTETGSTQTSTATINYLNHDHNTYDYVNVGGIIASNATLEFDVNSSNYGLNENVVFIEGTPGLVGLPDNTACKTTSDENGNDNDETYIISAEEFYGGPLSTYEWSKQVVDKDGNPTPTFAQLNVDPKAVSIDARDHGLGGTYRVKIIYDATATGSAICTATDEMTVTYQPPTVIFLDGTKISTASYCETDKNTIADLADLIMKESPAANYINNYGGIINWYKNAEGGDALDEESPLENGKYYISLADSKTNCISLKRSELTVSISTMPEADAGEDITQSNNKSFTMSANKPKTGQTGLWTVVSGVATIADDSSHNTTVILADQSKSVTLEWTVTSGACSVSDKITIGEKVFIPRINPGVRMRVGN
ncbi:hypothetical protein LJC28_01540 [Dysgonomonas sp. OttesenSCG-928-D17]|nr:hypothetical protein [Dysgonomonas sp. OttesenSCG-928-D17]